MQRQAANVPVDGEEGAVGGEDSAAARKEGEAYQGRAAEDVFGVALGRDAHDAAAATEGGDDV